MSSCEEVYRDAKRKCANLKGAERTACMVEHGVFMPDSSGRELRCSNGGKRLVECNLKGYSEPLHACVSKKDSSSGGGGFGSKGEGGGVVYGFLFGGPSKCA